jgi:uncharacterized repeat protein (TIGR01451 family)
MVKKKAVAWIMLVFVMVMGGAGSSPGVSEGNEPSHAGEMGFQSITAVPLKAESFYAVEKKTSTRSEKSHLSVIVQLEDPPLAAYTGGISGLAPTSPLVTNASRLDVNTSESQSYLKYLQTRHDRFIADAQAAIPGARAIYRYEMVLGGISMIIPSDQFDTLKKMPGVKKVYEDGSEQLTTEVSPEFMGADILWSELGGQDAAGEGVVVGIIDSGIWPEHPSFSDPDPLGKAYPAPPATWKGTQCQYGSTVPGDNAFTCNNKLIGAYMFLDAYQADTGLSPNEFKSARDDNGHGTHTASTAAGNRGVTAVMSGVNRGVVSGIAPRAHVVNYRACASGFCMHSDSVAAINQAIADGVDVINFSIGGGNNPYNDVVEKAFLDAYTAGVFVACSAGNDGPGADTVAHRGPWVTTVGASTTSRHFTTTLSLNSQEGDTLQLSGVSITNGIESPRPVVLAASYNDEYCQNPFPAGTFANGEIVVCKQGGSNARVQKSYNVAQGGAGGMILYRPNYGSLSSDSHFVPSVHLQNTEGEKLLSFIAAHTHVTGTFPPGSPSTVRGDDMASFSSRGGTMQTIGISKPDVTGPGVQILAGHTPMPAAQTSGITDQLFWAISGTSMSSPHVAGAGALLKDLHAAWTPGAVKSALMTTANPGIVRKEDGQTPATPFDAGSGRIDLTRAGKPGVIFDVTTDEYRGYENTQDRLYRTNYPSIYIPNMPGKITVSRSAYNATGIDRVWKLTTESPEDMTITVPPALSIPADQKMSFDIIIEVSKVPVDQVRHGAVILESGPDRAGIYRDRIPVTIIRKSSEVKVIAATPDPVIPLNETVEFTLTLENTSFEPLAVSLEDMLPVNLEILPGTVTGGAQVQGNKITCQSNMNASIPPAITVRDGASPGGYLSLASLGIAPNNVLKDESITNFNTSPFLYGGQVYTRVGIVSNGYAVIGGGDSNDVSYSPQDLPNTERPNNIVAPFWTDLDPTAGGNFYAAHNVLVGGKNYFVAEWENVPEYEGTALYTFQVWIQEGGMEEWVSMVYGKVEGDGTGDGLTTGAENIIGSSGAKLNRVPAPGDQIQVFSEPGTTARHVITFQAKAITPGPWTNCAEAKTDTMDGTEIGCLDGVVIIPGDFNGDGKVTLTDAMLVLKILSGMDPGAAVYLKADINKDGKIGIEDVIGVLIMVLSD